MTASTVTASRINDTSTAVRMNNGLPVLSYLSVLWLIGIVIITIYSILSYTNMKKRLSTSLRIKGNLYESDRIQIPFVMGLIKPKIYIPVGIEYGERDYIIQHEQIHIQRRDYIIKQAAYIISCFHWFNPLIWIAFFLMSKDMEMSCDEKIIKKLGSRIKKEYSNSLLSLAAGRKNFMRVFTAFGENNVKSRIKNVLSYKKPTVWIVAAASLLVTAVCIGLLINPSGENNTPGGNPSIEGVNTVNNNKTADRDNSAGGVSTVDSNDTVSSDNTVGGDDIADSVDIVNNDNTLDSNNTKDGINTADGADIVDNNDKVNNGNALSSNNAIGSDNTVNSDYAVSDNDKKISNTNNGGIEDYADEAISEYLTTPKGKLLKQTSDSFVKAYFSGDVDTVDQYLAADADISGNKVYQINGVVINVYDKLTHLLAKWYTASDESADVQYEHKIEGEDFYTYMGVQLKYSDDKWLVTGFYFEL
jgi:beta-lactamase regulating signal transducer with metallopeptidase domain